MPVLYDAQQGGETSVLSSSSSLVSPDRGQQQEQKHVSVCFAGKHVGKIVRVHFSVLPNSFPFLHPQLPSGSGPRPVLGRRRQSAVFAGPASSSSETCAQGNRFQKGAAGNLNLSLQSLSQFPLCFANQLYRFFFFFFGKAQMLVKDNKAKVRSLTQQL